MNYQHSIDLLELTKIIFKTFTNRMLIIYLSHYLVLKFWYEI